jgi:hypothetical protein
MASFGMTASPVDTRALCHNRRSLRLEFALGQDTALLEKL